MASASFSPASSPTSELLGPSRKRLLRAALREDVLERNVMRPDKGDTSALGPAERPG